MKLILKIIMVLMLIILNGSALAGTWVIGSSLSVISDDDDDLLNSQLEASGLNATANTTDSLRIVWQLYGGYDFSARWGVELSYLDLGKVKTTFTGTTLDIEAFLNSAQNIHPQTAQGWLVSMIHYIPFDHSTRVKARIGVYDWAADYTLHGGNAEKSVNQNGTDISFGIGLEMGVRRLKGGVLGHLKWDYHSIDKKDFSHIAVGISYYFK